MSVSGIIFDIKKYAVHDGPGLRTTVHFKGCPLSCWWCHNPESISLSPAVLFRGERCIGCGKCAASCPSGAIAVADGWPVADDMLCDNCGFCGDVCPAGAREICGRGITVDELIVELRQDEIFFRDGGGVTFSGGEPLLQPDFLIAALEACRREGYHRAVDTSGFVPREALLTVARHTDLFLYDLKHMDPDKHMLYTGVVNAVILENLAMLAESGASINVRFPFMPGLNSDDKNVAAIADFVSGLQGITAVNILPYHTAARHKHERWKLEYKLPELPPPTERQLLRAAEIIERCGVPVRVGG